jgi:hypothetical protein
MMRHPARLTAARGEDARRMRAPFVGTPGRVGEAGRSILPFRPDKGLAQALREAFLAPPIGAHSTTAEIASQTRPGCLGRFGDDTPTGLKTSKGTPP